MQEVNLKFYRLNDKSNIRVGKELKKLLEVIKLKYSCSYTVAGEILANWCYKNKVLE